MHENGNSATGCINLDTFIPLHLPKLRARAAFCLASMGKTVLQKTPDKYPKSWTYFFWRSASTLGKLAAGPADQIQQQIRGLCLNKLVAG
jgi:hypothetical protein